jgi:undecaprenyl-diphosphatase
MLEKLIRWDMDLLLWLNGHHSPAFDEIMWYVSNPLIWMPAYLYILYLCIAYYKKQTWYILLFTAVLVLVTDTVSVHLFKDLFMRLRPSHEPLLEGLVHNVRDYKGGDYGFVSSHACNYFGIAVFFSVLFARNLRFFTLISLFCVLLISYSRIYLGVHYPGDIICGAILGAGIGFGFGKLFLYFSKFLVHKKQISSE